MSPASRYTFTFSIGCLLFLIFMKCSWFSWLNAPRIAVSHWLFSDFYFQSCFWEIIPVFKLLLWRGKFLEAFTSPFSDITSVFYLEWFFYLYFIWLCPLKICFLFYVIYFMFLFSSLVAFFCINKIFFVFYFPFSIGLFVLYSSSITFEYKWIFLPFLRWFYDLGTI